MTSVFWSDISEKSGAYRLLAYAAQKVRGIPCPEILKDAFGKPFFPARPELFFSLSHTRGAVLVCLGDAPCGCDIERVRPVRPGVLRRVCAPGELAELDFFELWTLKESYFKLHGQSEKPLWEARFTRKNGEILSPDPAVRCEVYRLGPFASAVCARSPAAAPVFVPENLLQS